VSRPLRPFFAFRPKPDILDLTFHIVLLVLLSLVPQLFSPADSIKISNVPTGLQAILVLLFPLGDLSYFHPHEHLGKLSFTSGGFTTGHGRIQFLPVSLQHLGPLSSPESLALL